jgi:hypothetical protein
MDSPTISSLYRSEQRMIQFRAKVWKKIHKDQDQKHWAPTLNNKRTSEQSEGLDSSPVGQDANFCDRFLHLPGEVRNVIYDELLKRPQSTAFDQTPLFRSIYVDKRGHAGATFSGPAWLPINPFTSLRYIGRNSQIWDEIFSRWTSSIHFTLIEAFELSSTELPSIKDRLLFRGTAAQGLAFGRYIQPEASRVFDHSNPWFPLMRSCTLKLHVFGLESPKFKGEDLQLRLQTCTEQVAHVLKQAEEMLDLAIDVFFWPGNYLEKPTWMHRKYRPSISAIWKAMSPLKRVESIKRLTIYAGPETTETWYPGAANHD